MYNELLDAWKRESDSSGLERLPPDFYAEIADYIRHIKEEGRMLDKRAVKASLLKSEMRGARRMVRELVQMRFKKLIKDMAMHEKTPAELLTVEEEKMRTACLPALEAFQNFAKSILRGQISKMDIARERRFCALRFLKDVPEIIGADMKICGPFKTEDVASLPTENAKIIVKQKLAEEIEIA